MQSRDDYGYQGLASLYLDWAKRVKSEDESSDYVTKCETTISEGLMVGKRARIALDRLRGGTKLVGRSTVSHREIEKGGV